MSRTFGTSGTTTTARLDRKPAAGRTLVAILREERTRTARAHSRVAPRTRSTGAGPGPRAACSASSPPPVSLAPSARRAFAAVLRKKLRVTVQRRGDGRRLVEELEGARLGRHPAEHARRAPPSRAARTRRRTIAIRSTASRSGLHRARAFEGAVEQLLAGLVVGDARHAARRVPLRPRAPCKRRVAPDWTGYVLCVGPPKLPMDATAATSLRAPDSSGHPCRDPTKRRSATVGAESQSRPRTRVASGVAQSKIASKRPRADEGLAQAIPSAGRCPRSESAAQVNIASSELALVPRPRRAIELVALSAE